MSPVILLPEYGPPFDPESVAGMVYWFDFSDTSTLWQDSIGGTPVGTTGDPINITEDKSSTFTRNMGSSGTVPVTWDSAGQNGLGTAKFDDLAAGGYQHMQTSTINQTAPFTYFISATTPYNTDRSPLVSQNGCGGALFVMEVFGFGVTPIYVYDGVVLNTTLPYSTFTTVTIEIDTTTTVWNGNTIDTTGNAGTDGQGNHRLAGYCNANISGQSTAPGPIYVGEILMYSGALAPADVTKIQNYLINKWGA